MSAATHYIRSLDLHLVFLVGGLTLLALYLSEAIPNASLIGLFPFFILGGGDCGTGGGENCACSTGGCTSGTSGTGASGACTCAACSTPFLYVQNEAEFVMDNDVMFGKPSSLFSNLESGIKAFCAGKIKSDLYLVQKPVVADETGEVKLQIREIEPEVSAIFHASLNRLPVTKDEAVYVTADFSGCVKTDVREKGAELTCSDRRGVDLSALLCNKETDKETASTGVMLETGDYLDLAFKTDNIDDRYLIMESWYRDWTLGQVYSKEQAAHFVLSPYDTAVHYTKKGALAGVTALILGYLGLSGSLGLKSNEERDVLSSSFGLTGTAYADDGGNPGERSLEVAYRDTVTSSRFEVVEPRYARPYAVAIKIPSVALMDGTVRLRVTATKRHRVTNLKVVSGVRVEASGYEKMELKRAYHHREKKDYKDTLREKNNDYLKTYPSDIVTLTFAPCNDEPEMTTTKYHYLLNIGGVYAPASREDQAVVGDWVPRLDSEAKEFIGTVYKESFGQKLEFKKSLS